MFCRDSEKTVLRINKLARAFEASKLPVIYVRHQHKKDRSDIGNLFNFDGGEVEEINFVEGTKEVEYDRRLHLTRDRVEITKTRYSAFSGTRLAEILRKQKVSRLTVCGFMTNFCCESTARGALDLDFFVDLIIDATGTPGTENYSEARIRKESAEILSAGFARVFSTEKYIKTVLK